MSDTLDVIDLTEAQTELGLGVLDFDEQVEAWITAISRRLDALCGAIVERPVTETHDGGPHIFLTARPVTSITSVTEYSYTTGQILTAETNLVKPAYGYQFDPRLGVIYRSSSGYPVCFTAGRQNVEVVFTAGRYENTASVDARFKQAALVCLRHLWINEKSTRSATFAAQLDGYDDALGLRVPTFAIPRAAAELIADELIGQGSAPVIA